MNKIVTYKEEIYKRAGVTNIFKNVKNATKARGLERYVRKTEDALRRSYREIDELKGAVNKLNEENQVLRKGNKLWKRIGVTGAAIGAGGVGYGLKAQSDLKREREDEYNGGIY